MNSFCRSINFKGSLAVGLLAAGLLSSGRIARAQSTESAAPVQPPATAAVTYPASLNEVLKLVDAKVDNETIKAYIKGSPMAFSLTASQVIALKDRGVPQDVLAAMLQHNAELRGQGAMAGAYPNLPPVNPNPYGGYPYAESPYDATALPVYPADYSGYGNPIYPQIYDPWYYTSWYTYGWPYYYGCYGYPYYGCYGYPYSRYGYGYYHHFHDFHHHGFDQFHHFHDVNTPHSPFTRPGLTGMTARMSPQAGFNNRVGFAAGRMGTPGFASHGGFASAPHSGFAVHGGGGGGFRGGGGGVHVSGGGHR
ncbi:MAG: hypothetical protein C5B50_27800 [Verrucomicrobia bacterium]|nr:MAG: hypothetical protein C5B50_27800 [Verrucomicrobiota bacterium]